jgi:succinate dehydrogenase hydrophobic anchor subunit
VSAVIAIVLVLAGLLVGSQLNNARSAHVLFHNYRSRTAKGFTDWIRSTVTAVIGVAGLIGLVFVLLTVVSPH